MVIKVWEKKYLDNKDFLGIIHIHELQVLEESYENYYKKKFSDRKLNFLYFEGKITLQNKETRKTIICPPIVAIFLLTFQKNKLTTTINEFYSKLNVSCQDEKNLIKKIHAYICKLCDKRKKICVTRLTGDRKVIGNDTVIEFHEEYFRTSNIVTIINSPEIKKKISGKKSSIVDEERDNQYLFLFCHIIIS